MKRFACLAIPFAFAACGDNNTVNGPVDAPVAIDGQTIDAPPPIDAGIDAPAVVYGGTATLIEAQLLGAPPPAPSNTVISQGVQLGFTIIGNDTSQAPVIDTAPGTPLGCKVWEYTPAQLATSFGVNEGTAEFTVTQTTPAAPPLPACIFAPGAGYICPDPTSSGTAVGVTLTGVGAGATAAAALTLPGGHAASFVADDVGRFVKFSGTGVLTLDSPTSAFPIVMVNAGTPIIGLPLGTGMNIAALSAGTFTTLAGVGPSPAFAADPGQLADTATATAHFTTNAAGGGAHLANFDVNFPLIGDDFDINTATADVLRNIPTDGSEFQVACTNCSGSTGGLINIVTTDGSITGLSPFSFPAPVTKRVQVRCAALNPAPPAVPGPLVVPASISAYLMNSGATRIQATFIRASFGQTVPSNSAMTAIAGHAFVAFTTP
ncbi:MAG: hypothetical protein IPL61_08600 [Myxococcales bacterium]|nr:hypothetical protein [Myxococcales bacterium]